VITQNPQAVFARLTVLRGRITRNTIAAIFSYIRNISAAVATVCVSFASRPLYRLVQPCDLHMQRNQPLKHISSIKLEAASDSAYLR